MIVPVLASGSTTIYPEADGSLELASLIKVNRITEATIHATISAIIILGRQFLDF